MVDPGDLARAWPSALAALVRWTGDVFTAEDALQEAVVRMLDRGGSPDSIEGWLITTARRIVIDRARRASTERTRLPLLVVEEPAPDQLELAFADDRLAMLYLACDPALSPETRLALSLRFVLGVSTADIADVLLVRHSAMSARLTRAKQRITLDGLDEIGPLRARLPDMLAAIHSLFTIGHTAPSGTTLGDTAIATTSVELTEGLRALVPDRPDADGLLALLLFVRARSATRSEPLETADRKRWNRADIARAMELSTTALPSRNRFALEAGIAGVHSTARDWESTDWPAIVALYDRLLEQWPSPAARLARAVAVSHLPGRLSDALDQVDAARGAPPRHVTAARAHLLRRLGRTGEARTEYRRAILLEGNTAVQDYLKVQLAALD